MIFNLEPTKVKLDFTDNSSANEPNGLFFTVFDCELCGHTFKNYKDPIMHYDVDEMDDNGEVSLCDDCMAKTIEKAKAENTQGLSRKFFE